MSLWARFVVNEPRTAVNHGDIAFYYLSYVEHMARHNGQVKFICLRRDKDHFPNTKPGTVREHCQTEIRRAGRIVR